MKFLGLGALVLVVVLVAASFVLPDTWRVSRSLRIDAAPAVVRPYVVDLRQWPEWAPWGPKDDPTLQRTFTGDGAGARMSWTAEKMGNGVLTLTRADDSGVAYVQELAGGRYTNEGEVVLAADGTATLVTWSEHGRIDNPFLRWFGTSFEAANGADYERGLLKLQKLVTGAEKRPLPGATGQEPAAPAVDAGTP